jgi:hypothetical protein
MARKVKDSRVSERGVFMSHQGFPRWYVTGGHIDNFGEPVLLYVGASYFKTVEPEEFFQQLSRSGIRSDCVILSRETGNDTVTGEDISRLYRFARLLGISDVPAGYGKMSMIKPLVGLRTGPKS